MNVNLSFAKILSGLGGPIGLIYDLAHAGKDRIIAGIEKFTTCPAVNECKFNITHHGKYGSNSVRSRWITVDHAINSNDERLDGLGHQVDTSQEEINGELSSVSFQTYGESCIKSITIACGAETLPSPGYIKITYQHMKEMIENKWYRQIVMDTDHDCVRYDSSGPGPSRLIINASIFQCRKNDKQCITSKLEMH